MTQVYIIFYLIKNFTSMATKRKRNYYNYTIEFSRSMSRYGNKIYTWFISRPNFDRSGFKSSNTVWMYTTDDFTIYDFYRRVDKADFIRYIKSRPTVQCYNAPLYQYDL